MCLMVWKRTFYCKVDLSTTRQFRQLKLTPLSTQINIYCLMTNQMPALLVQRAPWTRAVVMLLQSASWQPVTESARSRWSYGKIEDCEQSTLSVVRTTLSVVCTTLSVVNIYSVGCTHYSVGCTHYSVGCKHLLCRLYALLCQSGIRKYEREYEQEQEGEPPQEPEWEEKPA